MASSPVGVWLLRVLTLILILVVVSTSHTQIDRQEIATPTYAIAAGHPSQAYVTLPGATGQPTFQAPGFPLLAGAVVAFWKAFAGVQGASAALTFAADCAVALVVFAGVLLVRSKRDGRTRDELVFLGAVALSPFFREALGSYFHPDDVLALALMLLALWCGGEGRWLWAGLLLGFAIGSKQWALLAAPALLLVAPDARERLRLLAAAAGAAALVYLPFAVVSPSSFWAVLRGPSAVAGGFDPQTTLVGMLQMSSLRWSPHTVDHLARTLPLLTAGVVAGVVVALVVRRRGGPTLDVDQALALLVICFAARLVEDCIALSYYALPLVILVLVLEIRRGRPPVFAVVSAFGLAMWYGSGRHSFHMNRWGGAVIFTVAVSMVVVGALIPLRYRLGVRATPGATDPAESEETTALR